MHRTTTAATWSVCLAAVAVMAQGAGARGQATTKGTDQTPIARDFLTHMTKGEYEEAVKLCDDTMKQALPADKLKSVWETITSSSGEFQTLGEPTSSMSEGFQVLVFPAKLKTTTLDLRVAVSGEGKISGFYILPKESYKPPGYDHSDKYVETQVEFGEEPWLVKGKLTMPSGKGPYPAVVLVHGSGPHDEDETIGPNKPFRDLAGGLSSNGIAVLRYQKRTFAHKLRLAVQKTITVREEVLDDAEAAVEYLRRTPGIDKNKVFVLGHSMGATLAPQIAAEVKDVAGVILLAGTGRDFYDVLLDQLTYIASAPGAGQEKNRKEKEDVEKAVARVRAGEPTDQIMILGVSATYWNELNDYGKRSLDIIKNLKCRILIAGGERDYQITKKDFDLYRSALKDRTNVTFKWYDNLNHLFAPGKEKAVPQEYMKPNHVDEKVIQDLTKWIKESP